MAVAGSIPSFAVGSWSLPSDTLANVHAGEMIIPSGPAQAFRDAMAGGGGGGTVNNFGGHTLNMSTHPGQDPNAFGKAVVAAIAKYDRAVGRALNTKRRP